MKNLKKVLALVTAFACAFTMFASAAYTDQSSITHTEAVDTLTTLNVIQGYADGSFKPTTTVTRAQMAKMIYTIRSGGSDDASAFAGLTSSFTDITGHWAAGYIKYCQAQGIISGKSATKFAPDQIVTVAETCKMALGLMGYKADKTPALVGANWASNTLSLATENELLDEVTADFTGGCSRDNAAQILFNSIDSDCKVWSNDKEQYVADSTGSNNTTDAVSVGEKWLGMKKVVGTLDVVTKDDGKTTYSLHIDNVDTDASSTGYIVSFSKVAKDYNQYKNMKVKVLYKAKDNVYGVYPLTDDNTSLIGLLGDFEKSDSKLKYDGTKYSVAATADQEIQLDTDDVTSPDIVNYVDTNAKGLAKAFDTKAIDNTGNSKINLLTVESFAVGKVSYVGSDYINASKKAESSMKAYSWSKLDEDSAVVPKDIKKDDYVAITDEDNTPEGKFGVTKLELVEGKITSTKNAITADDYQVKIGDNWYEMAMDAPADYADLKLNATVKVVVKDGYCVYVDDATAGSTDIALCIEVGSTGGVGSTWQADMLFADGTREVVSLNKTTGLDGAVPTTKSSPFMVTWEKSGSNYKLITISATEKAGKDEFEAIGSNYVDSKKLANGVNIKYINTDAVVFVKYASSGDDKYMVTTGTAMRGWSKSSTFASTALSSKSNGYQYADYVYADRLGAGVPGGSDKNYAYLFSSESTSEGDTDYIVYTAWNGKTEVTLKVEDTVAESEGTVVEYSTNEDGVSTLDTIYKPASATSGAITGYDWSDNDSDGTITVDTTALEMKKDDDCFVLFVDTQDGSGATGDMQTANEVSGAPGTYVKNCAYWTSGSTVIMVVDSANELDTGIYP